MLSTFFLNFFIVLLLFISFICLSLFLLFLISFHSFSFPFIVLFSTFSFLTSFVLHYFLLFFFFPSCSHNCPRYPKYSFIQILPYFSSFPSIFTFIFFPFLHSTIFISSFSFLYFFQILDFFHPVISFPPSFYCYLLYYSVILFRHTSSHLLFSSNLFCCCLIF